MTDTITAPKQLDGWRKIAVDFGPLLFFFLAYNRPAPFQRAADLIGLGKLLAPIPGDPGILMATAVFMVATAVAMAYSFAKTRHVPAMIWFSALLVGFFGGLTIWLRDETFIKMKPTLVYLIFAAILLFGLMTKRNYLQRLLGAAFTGLSERGWHLLAWRWALFFLLLSLIHI
jgi:intracellular septation protein